MCFLNFSFRFLLFVSVFLNLFLMHELLEFSLCVVGLSMLLEIYSYELLKLTGFVVYNPVHYSMVQRLFLQVRKFKTET